MLEETEDLLLGLLAYKKRGSEDPQFGNSSDDFVFFSD
jgi:hypothetical protein